MQVLSCSNKHSIWHKPACATLLMICQVLPAVVLIGAGLALMFVCVSLLISILYALFYVVIFVVPYCASWLALSVGFGDKHGIMYVIVYNETSPVNHFVFDLYAHGDGLGAMISVGLVELAILILFVSFVSLGHILWNHRLLEICKRAPVVIFALLVIFLFLPLVTFGVVGLIQGLGVCGFLAVWRHLGLPTNISCTSLSPQAEMGLYEWVSHIAYCVGTVVSLFLLELPLVVPTCIFVRHLRSVIADSYVEIEQAQLYCTEKKA